MNTNFKAAVVLVAILIGAQAGKSQERAQPYKRGLEPIREDARAKRLFVWAESKDLAKAAFRRRLDDIGSYIANQRKDWGKDWSLSFFTESRYAHYKDEIDMKTEGDAWAAAYIGEYDRRTATMTLYPLDPKRMRRYKMVPHVSQ